VHKYLSDLEAPSSVEVAVLHLLRQEAGIEAISSTGPDLPPQPGSHADWARDHEYKRQGTPARRDDLLTGKVPASVEDRHMRCERHQP
jgi:hypothetical protein